MYLFKLKSLFNAMWPYQGMYILTFIFYFFNARSHVHLEATELGVS